MESVETSRAAGASCTDIPPAADTLGPTSKVEGTSSAAAQDMPSFHLKCRLCLHVMPMYNSMPVRVRVSHASQPHVQGMGMMPPATSGTQDEGTVFMDAHMVPGVTVEQAIGNVVHNMPFSMSQQELQLRRMIPDTVIICMGRKMAHFEGPVDKTTGCLDVDHVFTPRILSDQHLSKIQSRYDPEDPEMKVRDCVSISVYMSSIDPVSGDVFSHLLASGALALDALVEHSRNVSTPGRMDHIPMFRNPVLHPAAAGMQQLACMQSAAGAPADAAAGAATASAQMQAQDHCSAIPPFEPSAAATTTTGASAKHTHHYGKHPHDPVHTNASAEFQANSALSQHDNQPYMTDYHMVLRTNFCNTFVVATVLPVWGSGDQHVAAFFNPKLEGKRPQPDPHDMPSINATLQSMDLEIERLRTGISQYVEHEKRAKGSPSINAPSPPCEFQISGHHFMPSSFRHMFDLQAIVKTQQALQQVYCMQAVMSSDAIASESNSMAYTSCSTFLQLHGLGTLFTSMTGIHYARAAPLPNPRVAQQFFAATMRMGLTPEDLCQMKAATHHDDIVAFMTAVVAGTEMDQLQAPYYFDCVLHSIMPVEETMAKADFRPVPGAIEYAPGSHDCFYKTYKITGEDGKPKEMHFRLAGSGRCPLCMRACVLVCACVYAPCPSPVGHRLMMQTFSWPQDQHCHERGFAPASRGKDTPHQGGAGGL